MSLQNLRKSLIWKNMRINAGEFGAVVKDTLKLLPFEH